MKSNLVMKPFLLFLILCLNSCSQDIYVQPDLQGNDYSEIDAWGDAWSGGRIIIKKITRIDPKSGKTILIAAKGDKFDVNGRISENERCAGYGKAMLSPGVYTFDVLYTPNYYGSYVYDVSPVTLTFTIKPGGKYKIYCRLTSEQGRHIKHYYVEDTISDTLVYGDPKYQFWKIW